MLLILAANSDSFPSNKSRIPDIRTDLISREGRICRVLFHFFAVHVGKAPLALWVECELVAVENLTAVFQARLGIICGGIFQEKSIHTLALDEGCARINILYKIS